MFMYSRLRARVSALEERMDQVEASQSASQQAIDEITGQLTNVESSVDQLQSGLADSTTKLQAEIDTLAAAGTPQPSLDALRAIAAELSQHVATAQQAASDIGNLQPTPPASV